MIKAKKSVKSSKSTKGKQARVRRSMKSPSTEYRPGTAYRALFDLGSSKTWPSRDALLEAAVKTVPKKGPAKQKLQKLTWDLNVLLSSGHSSNGGRSANSKEAAAAGKIHLIHLRKPATQAKAPTQAKAKPAVKAKKTTVKAPAAPAPVAPVATPTPAPVAPVAATPVATPAPIAEPVK